jgi:myo-inositol-1(or 4)-monophosphatase
LSAPASDDLLDLAVDVGREAARLVAERRRAPVEVAATKTSSIDVVTDVDRASEALIRERILQARPDDGFLGEEGGSAAGGSGVRWVVDPIDGTVNYLYDLPQYAVSIAAQVEGRSVAGVVVNAATGVTYTATLSGGAFRDGRPVRVGTPGPLGQRLIGTGFGYAADLRVVQGAAIARLLPRIRDIRRLGSCALDLCHVAEGILDGYVEEGPHLWDHAAGGLVLTEAGGRMEVTAGRGGADLVVAAPEEAFADFRAALVECGYFAEDPPGDG